MIKVYLVDIQTSGKNKILFMYMIHYRPCLEESCTRVPKRLCNFVCASDCSGKDSQAPFIPWKSKLQ